MKLNLNELSSTYISSTMEIGRSDSARLLIACISGATHTEHSMLVSVTRGGWGGVVVGDGLRKAEDRAGRRFSERWVRAS